jgi:ferric-dicitrate binding protein FerR (iron transport regulator)
MMGYDIHHRIVWPRRIPIPMTTDDDGQARHWFVRNAVAHSSEQRASFEEWLAQSAGHWRGYNNLRRLTSIYSDPAGSGKP